MNAIDDSSGSRYAVTFEERMFGGKCEVEITVDLATRRVNSVLSMIGFLNSRPTFAIALENLRLLARGISSLKCHAEVLRTQVEGATDHQLNCTAGGATAIVVQPPGKQMRFTFTIGGYHREGPLEELDTREIDEVIKRIDSLQDLVIQQLVTNIKG